MTTSAGEVFFFGEKKIAACLLLLLIELFMEGADTASSRSEVENHLELGKQFLARGQLADALTHYHAAVEGDPSNYLTFFKRGTVYLALGKTRFALNDFSKVLELKPDFTTARIQRANVYTKMGDYNSASLDYDIILKEDPYNQEVQYTQSKLIPAQEQWELVQEVISREEHSTAVTLLTQLLEISPWSTEIRHARAECYINMGDHLAAVSDLRSVNKLTQDSTHGYFRLAELLYKIGHATSALKEIRECLRLDPEHKDCFPFYKKLRQVEKALTEAETCRENGQHEDCIAAALKALKHEKDEQMIIYNAKMFLCSCYAKNEQYTQAIKECREALNIQEDANILCDRADAYIGTEMFDDAIRDFKRALDIDETSQRAKEGLEKAKRLQKQAERRDYYKILNVKRTASKREIVKAYRREAQKWHPDNFRDEEKKIAEKKFIDIAAAKEVLTDDEKRSQFDNGHDPLDPEAGNHGYGHGGNPFHHFQHGSPFQFKFHFN